jgi:hypothetical protein
MSCDETAKELLAILGELKLRGKNSRWKSLCQAIKSIRGKGVVNELCWRLGHFREAIETTMLVHLRYVHWWA